MRRGLKLGAGNGVKRPVVGSIEDPADEPPAAVSGSLGDRPNCAATVLAQDDGLFPADAGAEVSNAPMRRGLKRIYQRFPGHQA